MEHPSAQHLISVSEASFGYGGKPIIQKVNLTIVQGEFIGLIGPNGAGKSTLFKGLLKLIPAMAGEVEHDPKIFRKVGYVPQRDQLDAIYPLTAFDVAQMGPIGILPWYKLPGKQTQLKVMACLDEVGMANYQSRSFAELSGGQRQRILIARALAVDPEILVLDEPTAGIDPVAEESILKLLMKLNQEKKITILMVSHHIQSLRHRVHRAILIKNQSILIGPGEELLHPDRIAEHLSVTL